MRWLAISLLLLVGLPALAESRQWTVATDAPVPALAVLPSSPWNRLQELAIPGQPRVRVLPLLLLLPPDGVGLQVTGEREQCQPAAAPPEAGGRLVELSSGRTLSAIAPSLAEPVVALPPLQEGDVRMVPLLLLPDLAGDGGIAGQRCGAVRLTATWQRQGGAPPPTGHRNPGRLSGEVFNPEDYDRWYLPDSAPRGYDYLIITRESFAAQSTQLAPFLELKKEQGLKPLLVTFEEVAEEMALPVADRPEVLRGWLQANYKGLGLKYLLILASPNSAEEQAIPMKQCWPAREWEDPEFAVFDVPTDYYFADLTGNWNPDGDEYWCELEDYMELPPPEEPPDERLAGVDLAVELAVGRIPHFGALPYFGDTILKRLIAYQQGAPEPWHNRVLLPSPLIAFPNGTYVDGSLVSEFLVTSSLAPNGIGHALLGEREGKLPAALPGVAPLTGETMPEFWNQGYGGVFWCAHGNQEGAYRNVWDEDFNGNGKPEQEECGHPAFINHLFHKVGKGSFPPVVFEGSCLTADPAWNGNVTHVLLQHVAAAVVGSTRITMGLAPDGGGWEPSPSSPGAFTLGIYFMHAVMTQGKTVADAFVAAQNTVTFGAQPWTFKMRLEFNLFGDPAMRLPGCDEDGDCDDGDLCNGQEYCLKERCRAGALPDCSQPPEPPGPCRQYLCVPAVGCTFVGQEEGGVCGAEDPCRLPGKCVGGQCLPGPEKVCPPSANPCWLSACEASSGQCLFTPRADGSPCLGQDGDGICASGECAVKPESPDGGALPVSEELTVQVDIVSPTPPSKPSAGGCATAAAPRCEALGLLILLAAALVRHRSRRAPRPRS